MARDDGGVQETMASDQVEKTSRDTCELVFSGRVEVNVDGEVLVKREHLDLKNLCPERSECGDCVCVSVYNDIGYFRVLYEDFADWRYFVCQ